MKGKHFAKKQQQKDDSGEILGGLLASHWKPGVDAEGRNGLAQGHRGGSGVLMQMPALRVSCWHLGFVGWRAGGGGAWGSPHRAPPCCSQGKYGHLMARKAHTAQLCTEHGHVVLTHVDTTSVPRSSNSS